MQEQPDSATIKDLKSKIEPKLRWASGLLVTAIPFAASWLVLVIIRIIAGEFSIVGAVMNLLIPSLLITGMILVLRIIPKLREAWFIKKVPTTLSIMQVTSIFLLILPILTIVFSTVIVAVGIWVLRMWLDFLN